jgi:hypothetical protein
VFEYRSLLVPAEPQTLTNALNEAGRQGWLLSQLENTTLVRKSEIIGGPGPAEIPAFFCVLMRPIQPRGDGDADQQDQQDQPPPGANRINHHYQPSQS